MGIVGALFGSLSALSIGLSDIFARRVVRASTPLTVAVAVSVMAIATGIGAVVLFGSTLRSADLLIGIGSGIGLGSRLASYYAGITRSSSTVVTPIVAALSAIIPFLYALVDAGPHGCGRSPARPSRSAGCCSSPWVAAVGVVAVSAG